MINIRSTIRASILAVAIFSIFIHPAHSALMGDTITASGNSLYPNSETIAPRIVTHGSEFFGIGVIRGLEFDFDAHTLSIQVNDTSLTEWNGLGDFVFAGFDDVITSVTIASNTGFSGSVVDNFSFSAHSITLDMSSGVQAPSGNPVLVFDINQSSVAIAEPATAALIGFGLLGLAYTRRRAACETNLE